MQVLPREEYQKIGQLLKDVPFNCLFARSVVEEHVIGSIFVDDTRDPHNAYILHPYGMSLLIGDAENSEFESWLFPYLLDERKQRCNNEWMQVYPDVWNKRIITKLSSRIADSEHISNTRMDLIEMYRRVNFHFNVEKFRIFKEFVRHPEVQISRLDHRSAERVHGMVVPSAFWNNMEEFVENGVGFSVVIDNEPVSTAFSAFAHDNKKEIGIETIEKYRGLGLARMACTAFIDHCIKKSYTPVWSCRFENLNSYNLAIKLGFEPSLRLPLYRLCRH